MHRLAPGHLPSNLIAGINKIRKTDPQCWTNLLPVPIDYRRDTVKFYWFLLQNNYSIAQAHAAGPTECVEYLRWRKRISPGEFRPKTAAIVLHRVAHTMDAIHKKQFGGEYHYTRFQHKLVLKTITKDCQMSIAPKRRNRRLPIHKRRLRKMYELAVRDASSASWKLYSRACILYADILRGQDALANVSKEDIDDYIPAGSPLVCGDFLDEDGKVDLISESCMSGYLSRYKSATTNPNNQVLHAACPQERWRCPFKASQVLLDVSSRREFFAYMEKYPERPWMPASGNLCEFEDAARYRTSLKKFCSRALGPRIGKRIGNHSFRAGRAQDVSKLMFKPISLLGVVERNFAPRSASGLLMWTPQRQGKAAHIIASASPCALSHNIAVYRTYA